MNKNKKFFFNKLNILEKKKNRKVESYYKFKIFKSLSKNKKYNNKSNISTCASNRSKSRNAKKNFKKILDYKINIKIKNTDKNRIKNLKNKKLFGFLENKSIKKNLNHKTPKNLDIIKFYLNNI